MANIIPVIVHGKNSAFQFSREAIEEYNKRKRQNDDFTPLVYKKAKRDDMLRFDPVMAQVVQDLGNRASAWNVAFTVHEIEERYKDYITIDEYDGYEHLNIENATYILDQIQKVVDGEQTDDEKLWKIEDLLQQRDDK
jgi:hypothetical protein